MRRFLTVAVTVCICLSIAPPASAQERPCSEWRYDLTRPATRVVRGPRLIECVFTVLHMRAEVPRAIAVADRETGGTFNPAAYNASGCGGLFQHMLRYWPARRIAFLPRWLYPHRSRVSWRNPLANTWVTARMVRSQGWDPWT